MIVLKLPVLYIVVPCYNEEAVLPLTAPEFLAQLQALTDGGKVHPDSRILFVDDGSKDDTWALIRGLSAEDARFCGISLSRNRGHQNALVAGLEEAMPKSDITISIDCDGQDDISVMEQMVDAYREGCDIVYGVRSDRATDSFVKRTTARGFYRLMKGMGVETVYDHADYRLVSRRALEAFFRYEEVNLYLRGMLPLVGFKSTAVPYKRKTRVAGKTHYSLRKMLSLALNGITSMSVKPLRMIGGLGCLVAACSFIGVIWAMVQYFTGNTEAGWASTVCLICFLAGIQLLCLGVVGEYVGKIFLEVKRRPRYIIAEKTEEEGSL